MFRKIAVLAGTWILGWLVGFCPSIVGDIFTAYGRYRAELPADASPLAQRIYQQLGNAEGWRLNREESRFLIRQGNSGIWVHNDGAVSVCVGDTTFDSFTSRERSCIAARANQVKDKILEMRRDALARDLFKEDGKKVVANP